MGILTVFLLQVGAAVPAEPERSVLATPITADFQDADVRDAVRLVLEKVGANYALPGDLGGNVTARFTDVPAGRVLQALLGPKGYLVRGEGKEITFETRQAVAGPAPVVALPDASPGGLLPPSPVVPALPPSTEAPARKAEGTRTAVIRLMHLDPVYAVALITGANLAPGLSLTAVPGLNSMLAGPSGGYGGMQSPYNGFGAGMGQPGYGGIYPGMSGMMPGASVVSPNAGLQTGFGAGNPYLGTPGPAAPGVVGPPGSVVYPGAPGAAVPGNTPSRPQIR